MHSKRNAALGILGALTILLAPSAVPADPLELPSHFVTLFAYGAFSPDPLGSNEHSGDRWGGGAGIRWGLNERWALGMDAASIRIDGTTVRPFLLGVVYGPGRSGPLRPSIEGGIGYYDLGGGPVLLRGTGVTSTGHFVERARVGDSRDAVGGYFGIGLDWRLTSTVAVGAGARTYNWLGLTPGTGHWDGMIALRSGLSYRF